MTIRCGRWVASCVVVCLIVVTPAGAQGVTPSASLPSTATTPASAGTITPSHTTFGSLFRDSVTDFGGVPTRNNLLIIAVGVAAAAAAHPFDGRVSSSLTNSRMAGSTFRAGQTIGGAAAQITAAFATQAVGRATGNARIAAVGADLARAQILAQTMTAGVKFAARRTRPDGTQYSFPSGHTASAFATATVLQRDLGWKVGVPAYAMATYVAASRVQVQRHYLSDVTLGAALGIVAARSVTIGRGDARFAVAPAGVPGGAGVSFTWVGRK
jgi:membrane-associated phospholipid phosphatase